MTTRNGVYTSQARQPIRPKGRHPRPPSSAAQSTSVSPMPTSVSSSSAVTSTRSGRRITQPLSRSHSVFDDDDEEEGHRDVGSDAASAGPSRQRRTLGSAQSDKRARLSRHVRPRASRAALDDSEQDRATPAKETMAASRGRKGGAAGMRVASSGARKGKTKADEGAGQPQQPEDEESRKKRQRQERELIERWSEEYYEILEQLPLELQRSYVLMRELENKFQDRISLVADQARAYRDARHAFDALPDDEKEAEIRAVRCGEHLLDGVANEIDSKSPNTEEQDQGKVENEVGLGDFTDMSVDDADADGEEDAEVYQVVSGETYGEGDPEEIPPTATALDEAKSDAAAGSAPTPLRAEDSPKSPTMRQRRLDILASIARASSDALRIADEKVGVAVTAYDWVDRQIRRLDADLQRNENSLLLGLRAGTEASRGLQDALGLSQEGGTVGEGGQNRWEDVENLLLGRTNGKAESVKGGLETTAQVPSRKANGPPRKKGRADKKSKDAPSAAENEEERGAEGSSGFMTANMAIDPNEPTYCYCDQVSYGDMVACDNEDCPREWFHYPCIGFTNPPKGRWFCLFCAPPGYKGSGTYPADAPCLPPGYGNISVTGGPSRGGGSGTMARHKRKKR